MLGAFANAFRTPDLRRKLLFVLLIVMIFRLGSQVPTPGVHVANVQACLADVEDKACPCCRHALHVIGEDVAERLDIVPTQFRVLVTRRPRYGCRTCEGVVI